MGAATEGVLTRSNGARLDSCCTLGVLVPMILAQALGAGPLWLGNDGVNWLPETEAVLSATPIDVLLIEHDSSLVDRFVHELRKGFGVSVYVANDLRQAQAWLHGAKIEGVFLDLTHPALDFVDVIACVRGSPANNDAPIVVFVDEEELEPLAEAWRAGADHFLVKPLVRAQLHRLMRSIYGRMLESRRRYQRACIHVPVLCSYGKEREVGTAVNVSASGMLLSMQSHGSLHVSDEVKVTFPYNEGDTEPFELTGRVARDRPEEGLALAFAEMPPEQLSRLKMWVEMVLFCESKKPS